MHFSSRRTLGLISGLQDAVQEMTGSTASVTAKVCMQSYRIAGTTCLRLWHQSVLQSARGKVLEHGTQSRTRKAEDSELTACQHIIGEVAQSTARRPVRQLYCSEVLDLPTIKYI